MVVGAIETCPNTKTGKVRMIAVKIICKNFFMWILKIAGRNPRRH
jgi:hypothetical protein